MDIPDVLENDSLYENLKIATAKDDQLDIAAALRALSDAGDIVLVTVHDSGQKVRIWVDSLNTQE